MTRMDQGARAWLLKTAKQNYWRVSAWYEFDDLVQDGFLCWSRVVYRYEVMTGRVRSRSHLMSLFQRTYTNHIHDLAKYDTRQPEEVGVLDVVQSPTIYDTEEVTAWNLLEAEGDAMEYERLIAEAPSTLRSLLVALLRDGANYTLRAAYRIHRDGTRETINERLCRLIGANPHDYDYATALRSFLTAA